MHAKSRQLKHFWTIKGSSRKQMWYKQKNFPKFLFYFLKPIQYQEKHFENLEIHQDCSWILDGALDLPKINYLANFHLKSATLLSKENKL